MMADRELPLMARGRREKWQKSQTRANEMVPMKAKGEGRGEEKRGVGRAFRSGASSAPDTSSITSVYIPCTILAAVCTIIHCFRRRRLLQETLLQCHTCAMIQVEVSGGSISQASTNALCFSPSLLHLLDSQVDQIRVQGGKAECQ